MTLPAGGDIMDIGITVAEVTVPCFISYISLPSLWISAHRWAYPHAPNCC